MTEKQIGINIGTRSIKSVLLERNRRRWVVSKVRIVDHEYYGKEALNPGNLKTRLASALDGLDAGRHPLVFSIDGRDICSAMFFLPCMPKDELDDAVLWEMKNHIPFASEDFILNYRILDPGAGKGKQIKIHASAAKRDFIEKITAVFKDLGLTARIIIPIDSAIEQLLTLEAAAEKAKPTVILDLGDQLADIFIYMNGRLEFSRRLPFGMRDLVSALMTPLVSQQGRVQLSREQAVKVLHQHGIPEVKEQKLLDGLISNTQVLSLIRPKLEQLVQELQRSIDYYREHFGRDIERFVLLGGGAELKGLVDYLGNELGHRTVMGLIAENGPIAFDGQALSCRELHRINIAIGCALCQGKSNNLIPRKSLQERKFSSPGVGKFTLATGLVCLVLGAGCWYLSALHQHALSDYQTAEADVRALKSDFKVMYQQRELVGLVLGQQDWGEVLKDISNLSDDEKIVLTQIVMKNGQVQFKGTIEETQESAEKHLSSYLARLEEGMFAHARLVSIKKDDRQAQRAVFEIIATLK
jgi:type IV pilus assembly protein PilM